MKRLVLEVLLIVIIYGAGENRDECSDPMRESAPQMLGGECHCKGNLVEDIISNKCIKPSYVRILSPGSIEASRLPQHDPIPGLSYLVQMWVRIKDAGHLLEYMKQIDIRITANLELEAFTIYSDLSATRYTGGIIPSVDWTHIMVAHSLEEGKIKTYLGIGENWVIREGHPQPLTGALNQTSHTQPIYIGRGQQLDLHLLRLWTSNKYFHPSMIHYYIYNNNLFWQGDQGYPLFIIKAVANSLYFKANRITLEDYTGTESGLEIWESNVTNCDGTYYRLEEGECVLAENAVYVRGGTYLSISLEEEYEEMGVAFWISPNMQIQTIHNIFEIEGLIQISIHGPDIFIRGLADNSLHKYPHSSFHTHQWEYFILIQTKMDFQITVGGRQFPSLTHSVGCKSSVLNIGQFGGLGEIEAMEGGISEIYVTNIDSVMSIRGQISEIEQLLYHSPISELPESVLLYIDCHNHFPTHLYSSFTGKAHPLVVPPTGTWEYVMRWELQCAQQTIFDPMSHSCLPTGMLCHGLVDSTGYSYDCHKCSNVFNSRAMSGGCGCGLLGSYDSEYKYCLACHPYCGSCFGQSNTQCMSCLEGFKLINTTCECIGGQSAQYIRPKCETNCGDGRKVFLAEECDDGNKEDGDGCSSSCQVEPGYVCEGGGDWEKDTCLCQIGEEAAYFTHQWTHIIVTFGDHILLPTYPLTCHQVLLSRIPHTINISSSLCHFTANPNQLLITLGVGSNFTYPYTLFIKAGIVQSTEFGCPNSELKVEVQADSAIITPRAIILGESVITLCEWLTLDGGSSTSGNAFFQQLEYEWEVTEISGGGEQEMESQMEELNTYIYSKRPSEVLLSIPYNKLSPATYAFKLSISNFQNEKSSSEIHVLKTGGLRPILSGGASTGEEVYFNYEEIYLRTYVELEECQGEGAPTLQVRGEQERGLHYLWSILHTDAADIGIYELLGDKGNVDMPYLYIPKYSLTYGKYYTLECKVWGGDYPHAEGIHIRKLLIVPGLLVAYISPQDTLIPSDGRFSLSGSESMDPSIDPRERPQNSYLSYRWECVIWEINTECVFKNGSSVDNILIEGLDTYSLKSEEFSSENVQFKLTVNSPDGRRGRAYSKLSFVSTETNPGNSPALVILCPLVESRGGRVNPGEEVILRARSENPLYIAEAETLETVEWLCLETLGLGTCEEFAFTTSSTHLLTSIQIPEQIEHSTADTPPYIRVGVKYIKSENIGGSLKIYINTPPAGGSLTVTPGEGVAGVTSFLFLAQGWGDETPDLPLHYEYFISEEIDSTPQLGLGLGGSSQSPSLQRVLWGVGTSHPMHLYIHLIVSDAFNSWSTLSQQVTLFSPSSSLYTDFLQSHGVYALSTLSTRGEARLWGILCIVGVLGRAYLQQRAANTQLLSSTGHPLIDTCMQTCFRGGQCLLQHPLYLCQCPPNTYTSSCLFTDSLTLHLHREIYHNITKEILAFSIGDNLPEEAHILSQQLQVFRIIMEDRSLLGEGTEERIIAYLGEIIHKYKKERLEGNVNKHNEMLTSHNLGLILDIIDLMESQQSPLNNLWEGMLEEIGLVLLEGAIPDQRRSYLSSKNIEISAQRISGVSGGENERIMICESSESGSMSIPSSIIRIENGERDISMISDIWGGIYDVLYIRNKIDYYKVLSNTVTVSIYKMGEEMEMEVNGLEISKGIEIRQMIPYNKVWNVSAFEGGVGCYYKVEADSLSTEWSGEGCTLTLLEHIQDTPHYMATCLCDHLSLFALRYNHNDYIIDSTGESEQEQGEQGEQGEPEVEVEELGERESELGESEIGTNNPNSERDPPLRRIKEEMGSSGSVFEFPFLLLLMLLGVNLCGYVLYRMDEYHWSIGRYLEHRHRTLELFFPPNTASPMQAGIREALQLPLVSSMGAGRGGNVEENTLAYINNSNITNAYNLSYMDPSSSNDISMATLNLSRDIEPDDLGGGKGGSELRGEGEGEGEGENGIGGMGGINNIDNIDKIENIDNIILVTPILRSRAPSRLPPLLITPTPPVLTTPVPHLPKGELPGLNIESSPLFPSKCLQGNKVYPVSRFLGERDIICGERDTKARAVGHSNITIGEAHGDMGEMGTQMNTSIAHPSSAIHPPRPHMIYKTLIILSVLNSAAHIFFIHSPPSPRPLRLYLLSFRYISYLGLGALFHNHLYSPHIYINILLSSLLILLVFLISAPLHHYLFLNSQFLKEERNITGKGINQIKGVLGEEAYSNLGVFELSSHLIQYKEAQISKLFSPPLIIILRRTAGMGITLLFIFTYIYFVLQLQLTSHNPHALNALYFTIFFCFIWNNLLYPIFWTSVIILLDSFAEKENNNQRSFLYLKSLLANLNFHYY